MATVSVRLEEEEKKAVQQYANDNDLTVSQVIRRAIKEYLEKNK